jgi:hypothetical protein
MLAIIKSPDGNSLSLPQKKGYPNIPLACPEKKLREKIMPVRNKCTVSGESLWERVWMKDIRDEESVGLVLSSA